MLNQIFISKATFYNAYLMFSPFNTITTLNDPFMGDFSTKYDEQIFCDQFIHHIV